jgi:hypothetical protein
MFGGAIVSILIGAVGAILDYAVVESPYQHGFNLNTVGVILMVVGAVGLVLSLLYGLVGAGSGWGYRRHRTVVQDANGQVVRREDSYI